MESISPTRKDKLLFVGCWIWAGLSILLVLPLSVGFILIFISRSRCCLGIYRASCSFCLCCSNRKIGYCLLGIAGDWQAWEAVYSLFLRFHPDFQEVQVFQEALALWEAYSVPPPFSWKRESEGLNPFCHEQLFWENHLYYQIIYRHKAGEPHKPRAPSISSSQFLPSVLSIY